MFAKLKQVLETVTAKQSAITSISTITNGALGAAFYFLLARFLGTFDYGIFSLAISLITTLSGVFDLGSDQSLIMFIPKHKSPDYYPYIKLALIIKLFSGLTVLVFLFLFSKFISQSMFNQPALGSFMFLIGLGVISQLLFSFSTSIAQSLQKYLLWGLLFVATNLVRLLLLFVLLHFRHLSGFSASLIYVLLPLAGFASLLTVIKIDFLQVKITKKIFYDFFSFNKWIIGFVILSSISSKLDVFYTARFVNLTAVGVYSLSTQIVSVLPQMTSALGAVTSPKFSSFTQVHQNQTYTKKASIMSALFASISCIILIPLSILIFNFSGHSYLQGFIPFLILLFSAAIFLVFTPIRDSILYFYGKSRLFFLTGLFQIGLYGLISPYLMSNYSIIGSALVVFINILLSSGFYLIYFIHINRDK